MRDYENSKKKTAPKRAKKTTGKGRTSEDDENETEFEDENDQERGNSGDELVREDMSFLDDCSTQRSTIGNIGDDFDIENLEILATDADSMSGMIITEKGELVASGSQSVGRDVDMESNSTSTRQSPFPLTSKPNKRRKQQKDDAIIAMMREKTNALKELASNSSVLNVALNRESSEKSITQQYFDVFSAEIALLPIELRSKCQREVQQSVTAIIHKYQDLAEEMKNAAKDSS